MRHWFCKLAPWHKWSSLGFLGPDEHVERFSCRSCGGDWSRNHRARITLPYEKVKWLYECDLQAF